jgi:hypothetical protein
MKAKSPARLGLPGSGCERWLKSYVVSRRKPLHWRRTASRQQHGLQAQVTTFIAH